MSGNNPTDSTNTKPDVQPESAPPEDSNSGLSDFFNHIVHDDWHQLVTEAKNEVSHQLTALQITGAESDGKAAAAKDKQHSTISTDGHHLELVGDKSGPKTTITFNERDIHGKVTLSASKEVENGHTKYSITTHANDSDSKLETSIKTGSQMCLRSQGHGFTVEQTECKGADELIRKPDEKPTSEKTKHISSGTESIAFEVDGNKVGFDISRTVHFMLADGNEIEVTRDHHFQMRVKGGRDVRDLTDAEKKLYINASGDSVKIGSLTLGNQNESVKDLQGHEAKIDAKQNLSYHGKDAEVPKLTVDHTTKQSIAQFANGEKHVLDTVHHSAQGVQGTTQIFKYTQSKGEFIVGTDEHPTVIFTPETTTDWNGKCVQDTAIFPSAKVQATTASESAAIVAQVRSSIQSAQSLLHSLSGSKADFGKEGALMSEIGSLAGAYGAAYASADSAKLLEGISSSIISLSNAGGRIAAEEEANQNPKAV